MQVIAHRGANKEALENSWTAFAKAIDAGSVRIELDVQLTADGHALIIHDDDLRRTTGDNARVRDLTRDQLRQLKLTNGEAIPFLDEVVAELLPQVELNIEIKGANPDLAAAVAKEVSQHPLRDKVIISCFKWQPLQWFASNCPDIKRACLLGRDSIQWPFLGVANPIVFTQLVGANIIHPEASLVDENMMDQARARGWSVYAWCPMAGEDQGRELLWTRLKSLDIDGLCTNYPRELNEWLSRCEQELDAWRADNKGETSRDARHN